MKRILLPGLKRSTTGGWFPEQKLTIQEAIQAYTLNSAYAAVEETLKGSLTVGKLADITVLSDMTIPPAKIKDVQVLYTIVGGRVVYQRGKQK